MEFTMKKIRLIFLLLMVGSLTGCINYDESITLNADGSGTMLMHYSIAQQLFAMMQMSEGSEQGQGEDEMPFKFKESEIRSGMSAPGVTVEKVESKAEGDQQHFYVHVKFNKLTDLNQTEPFKKMPFEWVEGDDNITYRQNLEGDKKQTEENPMGDQMASAMLGNAKFRFEVKLPSKAIAAETNGTIQQDGQTVVWEWPLLEASKGKEMVAKFEKGGLGLPFSMPIMAAIGGGVVLSVIALVIIIAVARKM
jgi:hypothetical protein